jgi:hypothetical protein
VNDLLQNLGNLNDVKVVGLAVLVVIAFLLGWVVPKRVVDDAFRQRDRALDLLEKAQGDNEVTHDLLRAIKNSAEQRTDTP